MRSAQTWWSGRTIPVPLAARYPRPLPGVPELGGKLSAQADDQTRSWRSRSRRRFLQNAPDVQAFAKLPSQFGFSIDYTDSVANLRYYEPDFVAVLQDGSHRLIETKGREDLDVAHKDRAAQLWCENATRLTGTDWGYVKVPQSGFDKLQPTEYADLQVFGYLPLS